jgi:hypothetical protein
MRLVCNLCFLVELAFLRDDVDLTICSRLFLFTFVGSMALNEFLRGTVGTTSILLSEVIFEI